MRHLDLFSGIGGFALAAERIWPEIKHIFVEYDPFCQAVLKKHWPDAKIHGDIRAFVADTRSAKLHGLSEGQKKRDKALPIGDCHILTGGFPCQPFSAAGRRKGTADDRYLWPSMLEAVTLFKPRWVVAENVAGLVTWSDGLVLETVCSDLEAQGYEVQPFIIPAVSVGAPHRRDRVWIVAREIANDTKGGGRDVCIGQHEWPTEREIDASGDTDKAARRSDASDTSDTRSSRTRGNAQQKGAQQYAAHSNRKEQWTENWAEVAARLCTLDDGLSDGLVRPRGWRNAALKAAGNAIVPQVAAEIMRAIKSVEESAL